MRLTSESENRKHADVRVLRPVNNNIVAVRPWMTPQEAAEYLSVSVHGLYRLAASGRVAAHRLGKRLRFKRDDLDHAMRPTTATVLRR